jgi:hypothetical protein
MSDKPLGNHIDVMFVCRDRKHKSECAYHSKDGDDICQYDSYEDIEDVWVRNSKVAQTNAMVLALKDMGFEVTLTAKGGKS